MEAPVEHDDAGAEGVGGGAGAQFGLDLLGVVPVAVEQHAALLVAHEMGFFKKEGLQVITPDVDAFRKSVQATYQASDYAKVWPKGLLDRINATK